MEGVLERYFTVRQYLDDPHQLRTGTAFETACLRSVDMLGPYLDRWDSASLTSASLDEVEALRPPLLEIPATILVGGAGREAHLELRCWNRANCLLEGIISPYRAASGIARLQYDNPVGCREIVDVFDPLVTRYEDFPEDREALDHTIIGLLRGYVRSDPHQGAAGDR
ncbi:hypothetical protein H4P1_00021 (plasmid) [Variovorax sp. PBS-H4]|uniref:hypothetical protein n=1 Tax=Variovorax sp. PBS-H4 TaxID=434008 RepID=UPI001318F86A|nr:hypothetical protein [Variovorax sp. PBS-H4]VTU41389.1 hypothetical protein H4P1_00021 [Variovorax sp. PBS-H4]